MKYLLDTNILSELIRPKPEKKVIEFVDSIKVKNSYISVITIGEIQKGIDSHPDISRQKKLNEWLENFIIEEYQEQILDLNTVVMRVWGKLIADTKKNLSVMDSLIAATAITHNLILATRNIKDFSGIEKLKIINPWL
jgi:predicted nucleic acid-binding protein